MNAAVPPRSLRPDDVVALGEWLSAHRMRIEPAQLIAAVRVLGNHHQPPPVVELAPWLAPIFCSSASELEAFASLYKSWLVQRGWLPAVDPPPVDPRVLASDPGAGWHLPPGLVWLLLVTVLVVTCALLLWHTRYENTVVEVVGDGKVLRDADLRPSDSAVLVHTDGSGRTVMRYRHTQLPFTVTATHPSFVAARATVTSATARLALRLDPPNLPRPHALVEANATRIEVLPPPPPLRWPGLAATSRLVYDAGAIAAVAAMLLLPLGWWLYAAARRRGFLQRMPADTQTGTRRMAAGVTPALAAYSRELRFLSREMRRRRTLPSRALDVAATMAATLRCGGFPSLVFGSRAEPEYLVLVDRASAADHQALLADEIVEFFHAQGVCLERYTFDGDPRFCRHAPQGGRPLHLGPQSLELLFSRHPGARVLLFSNGGGLLDRYTGTPASWLKSLFAWGVPLLVSPIPQRLWGQRERLLGQAGLALVPLDKDGLHRLGDLLRHEQLERTVPPAGRGDRRKAYQRDIDLLLDRKPLPRERRTVLLDDLAADLGRDGMAWLAACAVYPEIHWAVTLAVGDALHPRLRDGAFARSLAQLSRLPWLRIGYMPDWLRAALLDRLQPREEHDVRVRLLAFLSLMKEEQDITPAALALAVASTPPQPPWRDALGGIGAWLRRRRPPANIRDAIFLRFMSGPRHRLAVDAGDVLLRMFYRHGAPLAGPRAVPLLAGVLGAALVSYLLPPVQRFTPLVPGVMLQSVPQIIALDRTGRAVVSLSNRGSLSTRRGDTLVNCPVNLGRNLTLSLGGSTARYVTLGNGSEADSYVVDLSTCASSDDSAPIHYYKTTPYKPMVPVLTDSPARADLQDMLCAADISDDSIVVASREGDPVACAYAANGRIWIGISPAGVLKQEDGSGLTTLPVTLPPDAGRARAIATSDNGLVAVAGSDGGIWILGSDRRWTRLEAAGGSGALAVSADGSAVAFANGRREVEVWQLRALQQHALAERKAGKAAPRAATVTQKAPGTTTVANSIRSAPDNVIRWAPGMSLPQLEKGGPGTPAVDGGQATQGVANGQGATQAPAPQGTAALSSSQAGEQQVLFSENVRVDLLDHEIIEKYRVTLDAFVRRLKSTENTDVTIIVHTNDTMVPQAAMDVWEVVQKYLVARGVDEARIFTLNKAVVDQRGAEPELDNLGALALMRAGLRVEVNAIGYAPRPVSTK